MISNYASLLIVGSEILQGKIQDLNGHYLAQQLYRNNIQLKKILVVKDEESEVVQAMRELIENYPIVIISGGLGPTEDDITKSCLAKALDLEMVEVEEFKPLYPPHHPYRFFPQNFKIFKNPVGQAPCPYLFDQWKKKFIVCLPGVPHEFKNILVQQVVPYLKSFSQKLIKQLTFRTRFLPEEKIFSVIDPTLWQKLSALGEVSSLPHLLSVDIGVSIQADGLELLQSKEKEVRKIIADSPLSQHVWSDELIPIENKIVQLAQEKNLTFSFAESCTGGLIAHLITSVAGSSEVFVGSLVTYQTKLKVDLLQVPQNIIDEKGVVSIDVALSMAKNVQSLTKSHIGLGITGFAGPSGEEVGTVCIAISTNSLQDECQFIKETYKGERDILKERFTKRALFMLLDALKNF